jgi:hypothetical protein
MRVTRKDMVEILESRVRVLEERIMDLERGENQRGDRIATIERSQVRDRVELLERRLVDSFLRLQDRVDILEKGGRL